MNASTDFFERRGIATHCVPDRVLDKARHIIGLLEQGTPYWQMRGKRLHRNRSVISIPVGRRWRLLALDANGSLRPKELLSHESYNNRHQHY